MARRKGRGGQAAISGGSPTAVTAPSDWAASTEYERGDVVTVGSGGDAVQARCVLNHMSAASGLAVTGGALSGTQSDNWRLIQDGALIALRNWSYSTTEQTTQETYVIDQEDETVGTQLGTTGQLVVADDDEDGRDVAQRALAVGNEVTLRLYTEGVGSGRPQYTGVARFTQEDGAFSTAVNERTFNFSIQGSWTRSRQA